MEAKLVVVGGEAQAGEYHLNLPTVVGRSRRADLKLGHPLVSRQHCELYEADGVLMVRDLGSLNGTFVGDARIKHETALEPGDLLTIGSVTFRAVYGGVSDLPSNVQPAAAKAKPAVEAKRAAKKPAAAELAAADQPAEIAQTKQAGGLAALEQLRESGAEAEYEPVTPVEPADDLDFGWLDEAEPDARPAPSAAAEKPASSSADAEAADAPAAAKRAEDPIDEAGFEMENLGDLDEAVDEAETVDPAKAADAHRTERSADDTQTVRIEEAPTGEEESQPSAPAKPSGQEAQPDDDGLDDFFKSLE